MTLWCPANRLEWYRVIILSAQFSGTAKTTNSLSGVILNNSESNSIYLSANVSTFLIAALEGAIYFATDTERYL